MLYGCTRIQCSESRMLSGLDFLVYTFQGYTCLRYGDRFHKSLDNSLIPPILKTTKMEQTAVPLPPNYGSHGFVLPMPYLSSQPNITVLYTITYNGVNIFLPKGQTSRSIICPLTQCH